MILEILILILTRWRKIILSSLVQGFTWGGSATLGNFLFDQRQLNLFANVTCCVNCGKLPSWEHFDWSDKERKLSTCYQSV